MGRSEIPSIERLRGPEFELLDQLRYDDLLPFAARYFFERTSWVTRLHHVLSLLSLAAIVWAAVALDVSMVALLQQIGLGFVVMFLVVLPFHEGVHAIAYRLIGAREIRWKVLWRYLAAYVVAERFVASRRGFFFVALAPFVVITPAAIAMAIAWPRWAVFWLVILLLHTAGVSGDWALMNYYWLHRKQEIFTYDDAGRSYFFGRGKQP